MARKKLKPQDGGSASVPISSMIDIIFLLIIFFVVTADIDKEIDDEKINLAIAPHGKPVTKKNPFSVIVNVRRNGDFTMGMYNVSKSDVTKALKTSMAISGANNVTVIVRGDADVQHEHIKKVVEAITDSTLYKIKLNAQVANAE